MATSLQNPTRAALPGRDVKPFPARNPSYRALSIIDAYSTDDIPPQMAEGVNKEPAVLKSIERLRSKHETIDESYASNFDIDEAYGSGEADLNEDDMGDVINLDEYDPYKSPVLPPRTSSRLPIVRAVLETAEEKPELPPKPQPSSDDYDPYNAAFTPTINATRAGRGFASHSEPSLVVLNDPAIQPALPPKDTQRSLNGLLPTASKSASQLKLATSPLPANVAKALPSVPWKNAASSSVVPKKDMASSPAATKKDGMNSPAVPRKNVEKSTIVPKKASEQSPVVPRKAIERGVVDRKKTAEPTTSNNPIESGWRERRQSKALPGLPSRPDEDLRCRKDSMIQSEKETSLSSSPRSKPSPTSPSAGFASPKGSFEEETAIRTTKGINRAGKPASLSLTKSNGSTAASVTDAAPQAEVVRPARVVLPSSKPAPVRQPPEETSSAPPANQAISHPPAPSQIATNHVVSNAAATVAQPQAQAQVKDNSISETGNPRHASLDNASLADDESLADQDMHRFKNLVKRKPVGTGKENIQRPASPSKPVAPLSSNQHPSKHGRHVSNDATLSPVSTQSLEAFPLLETQTSSTTTVLATKPELARPSTPPVLRSPTPLSQLEVSPSKYGINKKSERNLRRVDEERQSQIFGQGSNGVLRFISAQKALKDSFVDDAPRSPIINPDTVIQNEAKRKSFYHASLLEFIKERPRDSNAPLLSTTQLHCHNDHGTKWFSSTNIVHPINCAICDVEGGSRTSCSSCGLRICQNCYDAINDRAENTAFRKSLKEAKEETERRRAEMAARRARSNTGITERTITPSRPGSPGFYAPSDSDSLYGNQLGAASTQSLPGSMRHRPSQGDVRGQQYPPSAWNQMGAPSNGRPRHRQRTSVSSMQGPDIPPTPRIPDQYLNDRNSRISMPRSSKGSEMEMRGRAGPSPDIAHAPRYGSPMRGPPDNRSRSRPRAPYNAGYDPMSELRKGPTGPYPDMRGAGARTPGSMR